MHTIAYILTLALGAIAGWCLVNAVALHNNWTESKVNRMKMGVVCAVGVVWLVVR